MAKEKAGRIFVARETFSAAIDGVPRTIRKGQTIREGHPLWRKHRAMFAAFERPDFEWGDDPPVEQMTAEPGEKRQTA